MAIYVGEAVTILCAATNPVDGSVISDAVGQVELYAPGKSPARQPADRVVDAGPFPLIFNAAVTNKDGTVGAYVGYIDTTDFAAGKWTFKATLTGSYDTWEFGTFTLAA